MAARDEPSEVEAVLLWDKVEGNSRKRIEMGRGPRSMVIIDHWIRMRKKGEYQLQESFGIRAVELDEVVEALQKAQALRDEDRQPADAGDKDADQP